MTQFFLILISAGVTLTTLSLNAEGLLQDTSVKTKSCAYLTENFGVDNEGCLQMLAIYREIKEENFNGETYITEMEVEFIDLESKCTVTAKRSLPGDWSVKGPASNPFCPHRYFNHSFE